MCALDCRPEISFAERLHDAAVVTLAGFGLLCRSRRWPLEVSVTPRLRQRNLQWFAFSLTCSALLQQRQKKKRKTSPAPFHAAIGPSYELGPQICHLA